MRLCPLASGSSGNCIYVGSDTTHILVDVGISGKKTQEGLNSLDLDMSDIDAILITHEHSDHIKGLGVLSRKYHIPVYSTAGTIEAIVSSGECGELEDSLFHTVRADERFNIKDININPMHISHDAADPVAYRLSHGESKAAIVTDLGTYDDYTVESLKGMNVYMIEANHDVNMLQVGPYPYYLKKRILSDHGHLSNENSGKLISELLHDNTKEIILGHLSKENNLPELAFESVSLEITMAQCPFKGSDFPIQVAKRSEPSRCVNF